MKIITRCLSKHIIYFEKFNILLDFSFHYRNTLDAHHQRASSYGGIQHTSSVATTRPQSPQIPIHSPPLYVNKNVLNGNLNENETPLLYDDANSLNNYSLLCHGVTTSPTNTNIVKKRDKLRHRFSDVGSWGRRRKNKKGIRQFHSMNETIEVLADPVIEDDIFVSIILLIIY